MSRTVTRSVAGGAAALALTATALVATPGTAQAAAYNGVCGSGFSVIDRLQVTGGTVFLAFSEETGENCVVTVRNTPGARMAMSALLRQSGASTTAEDSDQYTTYAGPVKVWARYSCVDWGGSIGSSAAAQLNSHCG